MSTIYVFQSEVPALGEAPASDDVLLVYDTSAGRTKSITAGQVGSAGGTITTGTTAAAFSNNGITVTQTTLGAFTLSDPTAAGTRKTIIFPTSTGIKTVTTVATIGGSTISPAGATVITFTGTSDAPSGSIELTATSTSKWYITGGTFAKTTLGAPLYITTS
jgi:hypothetical protein